MDFLLGSGFAGPDGASGTVEQRLLGGMARSLERTWSFLGEGQEMC